MRFMLSCGVALLLVSSDAKAGFQPSINGSVTSFQPIALRISYDRSLGFGWGGHSSYWTDPGIGLPVLGATVGATWYKKGKRLYGGLQGGLGVGIGFGFFKQTGRLQASGPYFDLWGCYTTGLLPAASGVSLRQYYRRESRRSMAGVFDTPIDATIFNSVPFNMSH